MGRVRLLFQVEELRSVGSGVHSATIGFGPYQLDVRAAELRKFGSRIRLQEQPFQLLLMLLERPGEVVLREEIRTRLWPHGTTVEFDHSINAAVKHLRDALSPHFSHWMSGLGKTSVEGESRAVFWSDEKDDGRFGLCAAVRGCLRDVV